MSNIIVGIFYELSDGRIAYTVGFNGPSQTISYRFDGGDNLTASYAEVETWKQRTDLKDFPNAIDPRLPYSFDLFFDIKTMSQLKRALNECSCRENELREMMNDHNIVCEPDPIDWSEIEEDEGTKELMALGNGTYKPTRMDLQRYIVVHEAAGTSFANAYCISRDQSHSLEFYSKMSKDIRIDFPELKNNELECTIVTKSTQCLYCSVIKFRVPVETTKEGWNKIDLTPEWSVG
jgi:hypothetical protein